MFNSVLKWNGKKTKHKNKQTKFLEIARVETNWRIVMFRTLCKDNNFETEAILWKNLQDGSVQIDGKSNNNNN